MDEELKSMLLEEIESMEMEMEQMTVSIDRETNDKARVLFNISIVCKT